VKLCLAESISAYHGIKQIHEDWLREALTSAPHHGIKAASAIGRVIRCMHGLQDLHTARDLSGLEVYIGRATKSTLRQRWNTHVECMTIAMELSCSAVIPTRLSD